MLLRKLEGLFLFLCMVIVHQQKRKSHFCFENLGQNQSVIKLTVATGVKMSERTHDAVSLQFPTLPSALSVFRLQYERICMGQSLNEGPLPSRFFFIDCSLCVKSLQVPGRFVSMPCL